MRRRMARYFYGDHLVLRLCHHPHELPMDYILACCQRGILIRRQNFLGEDGGGELQRLKLIAGLFLGSEIEAVSHSPWTYYS